MRIFWMADGQRKLWATAKLGGSICLPYVKPGVWAPASKKRERKEISNSWSKPNRSPYVIKIKKINKLIPISKRGDVSNLLPRHSPKRSFYVTKLKGNANSCNLLCTYFKVQCCMNLTFSWKHFEGLLSKSDSCRKIVSKIKSENTMSNSED